MNLQTIRRISAAIIVVAASPALGQGTSAPNSPSSVSIIGEEWATDSPVPIRVVRIKDGKRDTIDMGISAKVDFPEPECTFSVTYLAQPYASTLYNQALPQNCRQGQSEYRFKFVRVAESAGAPTAGFTYGIFTGNFQGSSIDTTKYAAPIRIIRRFIQEDDLATAAFISTEVAGALSAKGDAIGSDNFRSLAIATGVESIKANQDALSAESASLYASNSASFVPSADGEKQIVLYQKANNLPTTGKLDWPTLKSASVLANSDIYTLSQYRIEALQSVQ